jgi:hypothetical protein
MSRIVCRSALGAVLGMLLALGAGAAESFDPGDEVRLDAGDGLLVLPINNEFGVDTLHIEHEDGAFGDVTVKNLDRGRNLRLIALAAGHYRFASSDLLPGHSRGWDTDMPQTDAMRFSIEAGRLNYAGDFGISVSNIAVHQWRADVSFQFERIDRALATMGDVDTTYPGLRKRFAWRDTVSAPDPFGAFLAREAPDLDVAAALADARSRRRLA